LSEDNIIYNKLPEEEKIYIKNIHMKFYESFKNIKNIFYSDVNINKLEKYEYIKSIKNNSKEYKIQYMNHRDKYLEYENNYDYDEKSSINSLEANNLHKIDALLVRYVLELLDVITIHDCFGVRIKDVAKLMDVVNTYYQKYTSNDNYSIFILK